MDRIIKFRIWLPQLNKFSYSEGLLSLRGTLYGITRGNMLDGSQSIINIGSIKELNDYVIQQFTNLLDINNKEIYEGDIVETELTGFDGDGMEHSEFLKRKVKWDNIELKWGLECPDFTTFCEKLSNFKGNIEVIGNIFENPDLIKNN